MFDNFPGNESRRRINALSRCLNPPKEISCRHVYWGRRLCTRRVKQAVDLMHSDRVVVASIVGFEIPYVQTFDVLPIGTIGNFI